MIAEKPSVARDIAACLGAASRGTGYLHGGSWIVTWALGHLVTLAEPHEIDPAWRSWRRDRLPMLPARWPLVVIERSRAQFEVIARLLNDPGIEQVVCATDAGREGELIFRLIYEAAGSTKPVQRLWISSLTPSAIRAGFAALRDGRALDPLADAARGRAQADWLVGMNLTRAYTLVHGATDDLLSVGRVQTPTLAMLVDREREIRAFVPEDYLEVVARFGPAPGDYRGTWFEAPGSAPSLDAIRAGMRLPADGARAEEIKDRVLRAGQGTIESVSEEAHRMPPPLLYDLTELQRHAHRLYGFSAQRTLEIAQRLYESHKLLSYPRTDSRHLSTEVGGTLEDVTSVIAPRYGLLVAPGTGTAPLSRRYVDDSKVTDHHAIIPTSRDPSSISLPPDEAKIYDLVSRRLLQAWHADHRWSVTTVITRVSSPGAEDRFHTSGSAVKEAGWKILDVPLKKHDESDGSDSQALPPGLTKGDMRDVLDVELAKKQTRPPKRLTEATLLTAMETAGRTLDDKELSRAMKDSGLGTPATRASIIETLLARGFVERDGKSLRATEKGMRLIALVDPEAKSPILTGRWESRLRAIERGEESLAPFLSGVEAWVREVTGRVLAAPPDRGARAQMTTPAGVEGRGPEVRAGLGEGDAHAPGAPHGAHGPGAPHGAHAAGAPHGALAPASAPRERRSGSLEDLLRGVFGHAGFRPHQEEVCRAVVEGKNVLLVMPTGAGKSLCYQLPGLARGGTTLVISPLIALMEDQVAKLSTLGVRAARIHSGRPRVESRAVCREYLAGALEILFIAPERLSVPGFPELLARRKPTLIAVDEAHCISEWGHDFRPDYRLLAERLPQLGSAPVIGMTATATPRVQDDIAEQLHLGSGRRFIHGFRRTNIAIEMVEVPKPERFAIATEILADPARRPAIVYAPSRKEADALARDLTGQFPAAAYHAGMAVPARDQVQGRFLSGELEVIVATIAFGMGVDKPNIRTVVHLALPGTVEGYYQEIGRAGRDDRPARAVLLHSFADRRLHQFFLEREYPEISVLEGIVRHLRREPEPEEAVRARAHLSAEDLERALEKLWIHGGARIEGDLVQRGHDHWRASYQAQRAYRQAQQEEMARLAESHGCRMLRLVQHFGDQADSGEPCGQCDQCAPRECVAQRLEAPTDTEASALAAIVDTLRRTGSSAAGALHRAALEPIGVDRRAFERLLSSLVRAGLVRAEDQSFEKNGARIPYQRLSLTPLARRELDWSTIVVPSAAAERLRAGLGAGVEAGRRTRRRGKKTPAAATARFVGQTERPAELEQLRAWRLGEARRRGVPAFRIVTDRALEAIAHARPRDEAAMLELPGVGPTLARHYGGAILAVLSGAVPVAPVPKASPRRRRSKRS
ncbi:MAG: DNA topoisomerase 3 [Deltaproteobacteria bacterium]|nr:DNA topoisomerase 3 [Deltaproteobacteria bacterium]